MAKIVKSILKLLFGIFLFVGLPLIGWGITDVEGFFENPARLAYVALIIVMQIVVVILLPDVGRSGGKGEQFVHRQRIVIILMQVLSISVVLVAPYCDRRDIATLQESMAIRYFGLGMFVFGFSLMNWAEAALGRQFSIQVTLQEGHQLVTGGLYRYVRHPRYLGIILFNLGIALIFRSWVALIIAAVLGIVLLWRIHDEEQLMQQAFGAQWEDYAKKSWRLIPFVY